MPTHQIGSLTAELTRKLTTIAPCSKELTGWTPTLDAYEPSLKAAADTCAKLVADMERGADPWWLTLTGINGCGKTMLAQQIHAEAKRINPGNPLRNPIWPPDWQDNGAHVYKGRRPSVLWLDERTFARRARSGEYDIAEELQDDFFLAFDELGVSRDPTAYLADQISALAERRLRHWMVWTTNLTGAEISERLDARITSRLIRDGNQVIRITAGDYAMRKRAVEKSQLNT